MILLTNSVVLQMNRKWYNESAKEGVSPGGRYCKEEPEMLQERGPVPNGDRAHGPCQNV